MKIPESIIEKYMLTPSGEQTGKSFMNNLLVYKSNAPGFESIRFMECNLAGEHCKEIGILANKKEAHITPEFLESTPINEILNIINRLTQ